MHERSIFQFLQLFFSFEMNVSPSCPMSDLISRRIRATTVVICVVINNCSCPAVKTDNTDYHAFWKYWMHVRGFLNYRLKYCSPKVVYYVWQPNERGIMKKLGGRSNRGPTKNLGGHGPPRPPPLESPVSVARYLSFVRSFSHQGMVVRLAFLRPNLKKLASCQVGWPK